MTSLHRQLVSLLTMVGSASPLLLPAQDATTAPLTTAAVEPKSSWTATLAGEYSRFYRKSQFLGQELVATRTKDGLSGNLFGGSFGLKKTDSSFSYEGAFRAGELTANPLYTNAANVTNRTQVAVDRTEYEFGVRYAKPNYSVRFGWFYHEEKLENVLTPPGQWSPTTPGRDPSNPARYTRSLSAYGGYIGLGLAKVWVGEGATYGIKLDGDFRLGYLESDIALLTGDGDQAKALYGLPHRATFFVSKAVGGAELFAEAGYRGEYNFTNGGGVTGYDYGYFGRAGFKWSF